MKVMGIDASTNSLAYGIIEDGTLIDHGEFFFEGTDINKRLINAHEKTMDHIDLFDVDVIVFEKAVKVRSIDVAIKMAEFFGAIKAVIMKGSDVYMVTPLTWQKAIGNPSILGKEKVQWVRARPELKTKSQIYTAIRKYRKQITMDWVEKNYGVKAANDNISDAIAIAYYGHEKVNGKT